MKFEIGKIRYNDLEQLQYVYRSAFNAEANLQRLMKQVRRLKQFYFLFRLLAPFNTWIQDLLNIYVCRVDGQGKGFLQLSHFNPHQLHIDYFAVAPECRGMGIGAALLNHVLSSAAGNQITHFVLEVEQHNPVISFYQKHGFIVKGKILEYKLIAEKFAMLRQEKKPFNPAKLPGVRKMWRNDAPKLQTLYLACRPLSLQEAFYPEPGSYHKNLWRAGAEKLKDLIMGNRTYKYVLEKGDALLAALELHAYPREHLYVIELMIHPEHENLRENLLLYALDIIGRFPQPTVLTYFYADNESGKKCLEKLGFVCSEAYYLMFKPVDRGNETNKGIKKGEEMC